MTAEQRNSYRCPIVDESQKAVLRVGKNEVVVALDNQSAGGFSVSAKGNLRVRVGQVIKMRTSSGWVQARVRHQQKRGGQTTLGLVRLADLPDPRDEQLLKPGGRRFLSAGSDSTKSSPLLLVMIVMGLGFWGFLVNFAWFRGPDATGQPVDLRVYLSRVVEQVTLTTRHSRPNGSDAPTANQTIE